MTRYEFGGGPADQVADRRGNVKAGAPVSVRRPGADDLLSAELRKVDGSAWPAGLVAADSDGVVRFLGPDDGTWLLEVNAGRGWYHVVAPAGLVALLDQAAGAAGAAAAAAAAALPTAAGDATAKANAAQAAAIAAAAADATAKANAAKAAAVAVAAARLRPVPIADRSAPQPAGTFNLSDGVVAAGTAKLRHTAIATCHGIVLAFSNWYNANGVEADGPQDVTLRAAVEPAATRVLPVYFGGMRTVVIPPGGTVYSDPVGVNLVKGQQFFTRTYLSVAAAATKFPQGGYTTVSGNGEGFNYAAAGADLTAAGAANVPTANGRVFGPSAILGTPMTPGASVLGIVGDSIAAGSGDSGAWLDAGWIARSLGLSYLYQSVAMSSQTVDAWYASEGITKTRQQGILDRAGVTHLLCELGVNSLSQTPTTILLPHLIGNGLKGAWSTLASFGVPVWQTTLTPQTTSTDAWATVANQTVAAAGNEANRVLVNAWLRDGAPITAAPVAGGVYAPAGTAGALRAGQAGHPLAGILEVADLVEPARDSGKWKAGYTSDGTHPSATGAAAVAAGLPLPALLGLVAAA